MLEEHEIHYRNLIKTLKIEKTAAQIVSEELR